MAIEAGQRSTARKTIPLDRVAATEVIDGVQYALVLERQERGHYRPASVTPLGQTESPQGARGTKRHGANDSSQPDSSAFLG